MLIPLLMAAFPMIPIAAALNRWKIATFAIVVFMTVGLMELETMNNVEPNPVDLNHVTDCGDGWTEHQCDSIKEGYTYLHLIQTFCATSLAVILVCAWQVGYRLYRLLRWQWSKHVREPKKYPSGIQAEHRA